MHEGLVDSFHEPVLKEHDLVAHAARMGQLFRSELEELQRRCDCIGDVRGTGLMLGMEIVNTHSGRTQAGQPERFAAMKQEWERWDAELCRWLKCMGRLAGNSREIERSRAKARCGRKGTQHECGFVRLCGCIE